MPAKEVFVLLLHALVGWILCAATMFVGMALTTMDASLIIHAIGAPIYFAAVSRVYFLRFHYTRPLLTAAAFLGFVVAVDFFVVGLLINRSLAMFESILGTWLPFALIVTSTLITGMITIRAGAGERRNVR